MVGKLKLWQKIGIVGLGALLTFGAGKALSSAALQKAAVQKQRQAVTEQHKRPAVSLQEQLAPHKIVDLLAADAERKSHLKGILAQESGMNAFAVGKLKDGDAGSAQLTPRWLAYHSTRTGTVVNPFNARQSIQELNKHLDFCEAYMREQLGMIPAWKRVLHGWKYSDSQIRLAAVGAHRSGLPVVRVRGKRGVVEFKFDAGKVGLLAGSEYVKRVLERVEEMRSGQFVATLVPHGVVEGRIVRAIKFLRSSKHGFHAAYRGRWIAELKQQLKNARSQGSLLVFAPRWQLAEELRKFEHGSAKRFSLARRR